MTQGADDVRRLTERARSDPGAAYEVADVDGETGDAGVAARIAAAMLGAALAAQDLCDASVRAGVDDPAPAAADDPETDRRRRLGMIIGRLETAQCILDEAALEPGDGSRLWMLSREVTRLAYTTVQELILRPGGSVGERDRDGLAAIAWAMTRLWGHPVGALDDAFSRRVARERLRVA